MTLPKLPTPAMKTHGPFSTDDKHWFTEAQMLAYAQSALEIIRQDVLEAGLANGGMEHPQDIYKEIAWQVREKTMEACAKKVEELCDYGTAELADAIRNLAGGIEP